MYVSIYNNNKLYYSSNIFDLFNLNNIKYVLKNIRTISIRTGCYTHKNINKYIQEYYKAKDISFNIIGGYNPDRKIVIKVSSGKKILSFCKVGFGPYSNITEREYYTYIFLKSKNVEHITCAFHFFRFDKNCAILFLKPTIHNKSERNIPEKMIFNFTYELYDKTKQNILFEDSDFYNNLIYTKKRLFRLKNKEIYNFVETNIKIIQNENKSKIVSYSIAHTDYKPGNFTYEDNNFYVIDWETNCFSYPKYFDKWMYICLSLPIKGIKDLVSSNPENKKYATYFIVDFIKRMVQDDEFGRNYHQNTFTQKICDIIKFL